MEMAYIDKSAEDELCSSLKCHAWNTSLDAEKQKTNK